MIFNYNATRHDDMETLSHYWPFVRGIQWSPVDYPNEGQAVMWKALMFSLLLLWRSCWIHNQAVMWDAVTRMWRQYSDASPDIVTSRSKPWRPWITRNPGRSSRPRIACRARGSHPSRKPGTSSSSRGTSRTRGARVTRVSTATSCTRAACRTRQSWERMVKIVVT